MATYKMLLTTFILMFIQVMVTFCVTDSDAPSPDILEKFRKTSNASYSPVETFQNSRESLDSSRMFTTSKLPVISNVPTGTSLITDNSKGDSTSSALTNSSCDSFEETVKHNICSLKLINCSGTDLRNIELKNINYSSDIRRADLENLQGDIKAGDFDGFLNWIYYLDVSYTPVEKKDYRTHNTTYLRDDHTLESFELSYAKLSPLPQNKIKKITLRNGTSESLGYCWYLTNLTLISWDIKLIPDEWLSECNIMYLTIEHQPLNEVLLKKVLQNGVSQLLELTIRHCLLESVDKELTGANRLRRLDLSHNQLHYFLINTALPSLRELDVSHNHIFGSALLSSGITTQPSLTHLWVDDNPYFTLCDAEEYAVAPFDDAMRLHQPLKGRHLSLRNLEFASFRETSISSLCLSRITAPGLKYLDFGDNHIDTVQLLGLPSTEQDLTINLSGNPIYQFPFEEQEYNRLKQLGYKLTLTGFNHTADCDCRSWWLQRALQDDALRAAVRCAGGGATHRCEKMNCVEGCVCRRNYNSTDTAATCRDLAALPGKLIELLRGSDENITIRQLDLTKNRINRLDAIVTDALFHSNVTRTVLLAGNPILCDCQNENFIRSLQENKDKIPDYTNLTCLDETTLISNVSPFWLCFEPLHHKQWFIIVLAVTVSVASAVILCVAAYCRYKKEIKIYLYARGLCLCCVKETELDSEREYDAFVSFSHKDEKFVTEKFLPTIDKDYKICVHYRDWIAGEMIPNQIVNSVNNSRRTIIILSKNFVESIWGLLEFKTAHVSALKEGRVRVIIVVLDDIIEDANLDVELKSYLRTNTYIKFGDPWFWKKLFYAMPHVPLEKDLRSTKEIKSNTDSLDVPSDEGFDEEKITT